MGATAGQASSGTRQAYQLTSTDHTAMPIRTEPIFVLIYCLTTFATLAGCSNTNEPAEQAAADPTAQEIPNPQPATTTEPTDIDSDATDSNREPSADPTSADPTSTDSTEKNQAVNQAPPDDATGQLEYTPPFPDRVDFFASPKRQANRCVIADGQSSEAVELVGFVNVNGPRVVLSINGLEAPIAQGESRYGIEVILIQPPGVVLQRGRERWQATLTN